MVSINSQETRIFFFYDIVLIGLSLSSQSILVIVFSIMTILMFHILITKEEKYLENVHGEDYRKYKRQQGDIFNVWSRSHNSG